MTTTRDEAPRLLEVDNLRVDFKTHAGWTNVVTDVSFSVGPGQVVGLVGESGSGKTVACSSILRLIPEPPGRVSGGSIRFEGRELTTLSQRQLSRIRGRDIAMVFQEPMTSLNPVLTIGEQITEVVRHHLKLSRRDARARAVEVMDQVGIPNAASRLRQYPHEFSGGMRQRVMIAIAIATRPKLLLADEPTTALDVTIQAQILELIRDLGRELDMGVLLVTHDLGVVADVCDDVVVMYAGQVVERATTLDLFREPEHPYTACLMKARPDVEQRSKLFVIPGSPPLPSEFALGCRFAARCPHRIDRCETEPVPLTQERGRESRCLRSAELSLEGTS